MHCLLAPCVSAASNGSMHTTLSLRTHAADITHDPAQKYQKAVAASCACI